MNTKNNKTVEVKEYTLLSDATAAEMAFMWMLSDFTDNAPLDKLAKVHKVMGDRLKERRGRKTRKDKKPTRTNKKITPSPKSRS